MYSNRSEHSSFLVNALTWKGSVTPVVLRRIIATFLYAIVITVAHHFYPSIELSFGPFELFGMVIGLMLVFRTNAGHERWWEARKIWGGIVNQSRNLAYGTVSYSNNNAWKNDLLRWIIAFPYVCMQQLSEQDALPYLKTYFNASELNQIENAPHMPSYVNLEIARLLFEAKSKKFIDDFTFLQLDKERSLLIDYIGASERILKTPIPLVYAVKTRRLIFIFLLLLPFALLDKTQSLTPLFVVLVSYPLFSLDQIGIELQNPFSTQNLSHLPLLEICGTIERNILNVNLALRKNIQEKDLMSIVE